MSNKNDKETMIVNINNDDYILEKLKEVHDNFKLKCPSGYVVDIDTNLNNNYAIFVMSYKPDYTETLNKLTVNGSNGKQIVDAIEECLKNTYDN